MNQLPKSYITECGWLRAGDPTDDLVISSRIRLARNIEGIPFSQWASSTDLKRIAEQTRKAVSNSDHLHNPDFYAMEELEPLDRYFLAERNMISRELAKSGIERYVAISPDQTSSVMINEEDHLRIQVLMAGSNLSRVWTQIDAVDNELEDHLTYAFSNQFGYLTACPTNVGTGIRCSVMVHLPALVISRRIDKVFSAVSQMGVAVRGFAGEGSEISGNLFQISNQWTLGISEKETIEKIEKLLEHILGQERKAQEKLFEENRCQIEDRVWRAYATLRYAKVISSNEAIELFSSIRLGLNLGILNKPRYESLNEMILKVRPAHLQKFAERAFTAAERDEFRADLIRRWIMNGDS
ncbi:MAG: protein arginine kinase [Candidatus Omnitrophica bacterium]|nr:protein arginine kinase [Candidatus Omnitrophota bacterium]